MKSNTIKLKAEVLSIYNININASSMQMLNNRKEGKNKNRCIIGQFYFFIQFEQIYHST